MEALRDSEERQPLSAEAGGLGHRATREAGLIAHVFPSSDSSGVYTAMNYSGKTILERYGGRMLGGKLAR